MDVTTVVKSSLGQLGYEIETNGHWRFEVIGFFMTNFAVDFIIKFITFDLVKKERIKNK